MLQSYETSTRFLLLLEKTWEVTLLYPVSLKCWLQHHQYSNHRFAQTFFMGHY